MQVQVTSHLPLHLITKVQSDSEAIQCGRMANEFNLRKLKVIFDKTGKRQKAVASVISEFLAVEFALWLQKPSRRGWEGHQQISWHFFRVKPSFCHRNLRRPADASYLVWGAGGWGRRWGRGLGGASWLRCWAATAWKCLTQKGEKGECGWQK